MLRRHNHSGFFNNVNAINRKLRAQITSQKIALIKQKIQLNKLEMINLFYELGFHKNFKPVIDQAGNVYDENNESNFNKSYCPEFPFSYELLANACEDPNNLSI